MAIRKLRKTIALVTAMTLAASAVPSISHSTEAGTETGTEAGTETGAEDTGETAEGTDESGEGGAAGQESDGNTIKEDGEVVQKGALGKVDKKDWITIKDYEFITENDTYKMYFYKPRLSIMLENKETGKFIESTLSDEKDDGNSNATWNYYMKSGIVITAIVGTNSTYQVDLFNTPNTIQYKKIDNGLSATIYYTDYKFGLTVDITLEGDDLVVNIPDDYIVEEKEETYIGTVSVFPFMGYSFLDDREGYMLIPDGNGALINLDNKEGRYVTGYSQMIYGSDAGFRDTTTKEYLNLGFDIDMSRNANKVLAPVFGMAHTDEQTGYIAVVEDGYQRASIEAHPNGVMVNYNRCFAKFLLRDVFNQPLNNSESGRNIERAEEDRTHINMKVRYMLLSGDDADYSAMAVRYRNYLLDTGAITKKDSAYNTRVDFLGTDREEFLFGTRAVTVTTVENIEKMYGELKGKGVQSLLSVYKGWQKGGLYNVPITKYKADSHIGGTSKLTDLIKEADGYNYHVYLYNDALRLNPETSRMTFDMIKQINKRTFKEEEWAEVYKTFYYLTPNKTTSDLDKFVSSYTKNGVSNLAVGGISNTLYSYSYKSRYYSKLDTQDKYAKLLKSVDDKTNLVLEEPVSYLWKNTDAFLDMPLGSSDYMYVDQEVPFMSMVLKGIIPMYSDYVNFEANKQEFFLQMVEAGVYPSFYLTYENSSKLLYTNSSNLFSTEYNTYKDTIAQYDKELRKINEVTADALIIDNEKLDNGVTVVTYDNGAKVYVNYSEEAQTVGNVTVNAMSYKAGEPNE
ncbi:MAG: hypothetical protein K2K35_07870 [Lachnospiraceae bacterium]|nr:hypothetical protein [Lachnospiraceae bacterium]